MNYFRFLRKYFNHSSQVLEVRLLPLLVEILSSGIFANNLLMLNSEEVLSTIKFSDILNNFRVLLFC